MTLSVSQIVLRAKQRELQELQRLNLRVQLVGLLGHMVHVLQSERGASSIFLASSGERFREKRESLILESDAVTHLLLENIKEELEETTFANARIISSMAWVMLGLDALPGLRERITRRQLSGYESVAAFSRLIAGLISLIFEMADAGVDPVISRLMVSLFYLVDGKEMAGQERATGALAFGSGSCNSRLQQQILDLIDAQERSFRIFLEFADDNLNTLWHDMENARCIARLMQMRQMIRSANAETRLDADISNAWFDCCSERITYMWKIQRELVDTLRARCESLITNAQGALRDSKGLLQSLRENPPDRADVLDHFFDPDLPIGHSLIFQQAGYVKPQQPPRSIIDLLMAQSERLESIETELESAKRALNDRKTIERAKGILMARYQYSEDQAYKQLRNISMDQNRRLAEVAESVLSLPDLKDI